MNGPQFNRTDPASPELEKLVRERLPAAVIRARLKCSDRVIRAAKERLGVDRLPTLAEYEGGCR